MELVPDIEIVAIRGGFVMKTVEHDPVTGEDEATMRVCGSIAEIVTHTIRTLESFDKWEPKEYDRIERRMNDGPKHEPRP